MFRLAGLLPAMLLATSAAAPADEPPQPPLGLRVFRNSRDPPSDRVLDATAQAQADLGHAVFNTQWVIAGTANAARRDGLGPFFNAASCDACHNEGLRGRGPSGDGPAPAALVLQLERRIGHSDLTGVGDPLYGHVLNTQALPGLRAEANVSIEFDPRRGRYPDGQTWQLRSPRYRLSHLRYGPLASNTVIKPRLAPSLFGVGLLEAVPSNAVLAAGSGQPAWQTHDGKPELGRLGWQAQSLSIRDQSAKAFAREMGLTSALVRADDCTTAESDCLAQPNGGTPEVSDELFEAVVAFQRTLAVPMLPGVDGDSGDPDARFVAVGCVGCHTARMPVEWPDTSGSLQQQTIAPYTDLRLHDLGRALADRDARGRVMTSMWRTAPLWGMAYRLRTERAPTFLHDGRARTLEEAILWHDGDARASVQAFEHLSNTDRQALLRWLATL